ncbi:MAG TPA: crotonase/enoyl-CoA hydratase family protein [Rhodobacteraceae bacterium]|jgi:methylglutaconyl-CoA hydratase|nr:crotonase/enoyl-CoA hydratase family protein [Paracoccaceae bacterium]
MVDISIDARGVANLTLNNPDKHNILTPDAIAGLTDAAATLGADGGVRVVVLSGTGKSFCAGGDLVWMQKAMAADHDTRNAEARKLATMLQALNTMPKPLIGRIQGQAYGGGVGLISVCDVAIGVKGARFGLTETKLGVTPATISPYVIARMTEAKARRVFMSSRLFDADEAVALNLLAKVVEADQLDAAIELEIAAYLKCAPGAVADAKVLARALGPVIDDAVIDLTVKALVDRWESDEIKEGLAAFFEKRDADWIVK